MRRSLLAAVLALPGSARALDLPDPGPGWTGVHRTASVAVYTRQDPGEGVPEILAYTEVAAPPRAVAAVLADFARYPAFMPYTAETRVLSAEAGRLRVYQRLRPPLVSDRDYVIDVVMGWEGEVWTSRWTAAPEALPEVGGCVRVRRNTGGWRAEPLDGGRRTRLTHHLRTDPGGDLPAAVAVRSNTVAVPGLLAAVGRRVAALAAGG